jgi:hypothetical protein
MANTRGKVNPTVSQVHRPNHPVSQGNTHDADRSHIKGPAKRWNLQRAKEKGWLQKWQIKLISHPQRPDTETTAPVDLGASKRLLVHLDSSIPHARRPL